MATMALDVAVVMDPIEKIKVSKDTSFAMMLEARRRGHRLHYVAPGGLSLDGSRPMARLAPVEVRDQTVDWFTLGEARLRPLAEMDVVLMRTDPPVDADYLHDTHILSVAQASAAPKCACNTLCRAGELPKALKLGGVSSWAGSG